MKLRKLQSGFSVVELVIILAVVGVLAFVGYAVYNRQHNTTSTANNNSSQTVNDETKASDVPPAPVVSSTSDLDKASATLDKVDPGTSNSSDSSQLDSQLSAF